MGVSSYFEFVSVLFGWVLYDNLYVVLADSGIVYIPLLIIIASNVIESRKAGDDEGNAAVQSVKKIETDIVIAIFVLILCVIPMSTVSLSEMRFVKPALNCNQTADTILGTDTRTTVDTTLQTLGGETGRAPLWWALIHIVTKSVTAASIASIPCSYDLASVSNELANDKIDSPSLRREIQDFINDCYMPAKASLFRNRTVSLSASEANSINWLGSDYFLTTPGYYNKFYSSTARADWPFQLPRDNGFERDAPSGGHPTCVEWWTGGQGIRARVLQSLDPDLLDTMVYAATNLVQISTTATLDTTERENVLLRKYLAINITKSRITDAGGNIGVDYDVSAQSAGSNARYGRVATGLTKFGVDAAANAFAIIGGALSAPGHLAGGKLLREGVSFGQSLLLMMFITLLPFMLVFSLYRPHFVLTLTVVFFAINFLSFIWAIAYWIDNNLTNVLLSGAGSGGGLANATWGAFTPVHNATEFLTLVWMQRFLYLALPIFWIGTLSWVGFRVGTALGATIGSTVGQASDATGQKGGDASVEAAKMAASKKL